MGRSPTNRTSPGFPRFVLRRLNRFQRREALVRYQNNVRISFEKLPPWRKIELIEERAKSYTELLQRSVVCRESRSIFRFHREELQLRLDILLKQLEEPPRIFAQANDCFSRTGLNERNFLKLLKLLRRKIAKPTESERAACKQQEQIDGTKPPLQMVGFGPYEWTGNEALEFGRNTILFPSTPINVPLTSAPIEETSDSEVYPPRPHKIIEQKHQNLWKKALSLSADGNYWRHEDLDITTLRIKRPQSTKWLTAMYKETALLRRGSAPACIEYIVNRAYCSPKEKTNSMQ